MAISINLTPSPTNPQRSDPDNFRENADQYVDWHTQDFVPEMNTVINDLNTTIQNLWVGTSTTSNTIGTGSKTFTMAQTDLAFGIGNSVRVADTSVPTLNYMSGTITAYNKTTKVITVNVLTSAGSGTKTSWSMALEPPDEYNRVKTWAPAPEIIYNFTSTDDGFTAVNATITSNVDSITLTATATDPNLTKSGLAINGAVYTIVRARIKAIIDGGWEGILFYGTSLHGYSAGYRKVITKPTLLIAGGDYVIAEWDMSQLTSGLDDWINSIILSLRFDLYQENGTSLEIDWISLNQSVTDAAMTGPASMPLIAQYRGVYYGLNTNLLDASTKVPGVDPQWTPFGHTTYQEFTASGTWAKPIGCNYVYVQCISGGSSGGAAISSGGVPVTNAPWGGAGGMCFEKLFLASDFNDEEIVVVGSGGAAKSVTGLTGLITGGNIGGVSSFGTFTGVLPDTSTFPAFSGQWFSSELHTAYSYRGGNGAKNLDSFIGGGGGGTLIRAAGGVSQHHGNGGNSSVTTDKNATGYAGSAPGGGGGCAIINYNTVSRTATSGAGARGCVRVWTW